MKNTLKKTQNGVAPVGDRATEIVSCLLLNSSHMTFEDDAVLTMLTGLEGPEEEDWRWIHETSGGFIFRMKVCPDAGDRLRKNGVSVALCRLLETVARDYDVADIQFDIGAAVLPGWPVYEWQGQIMELTESTTTQEAAGELAATGRGVLTVLETHNESVRGLHFCNHALLSGSNYNLWFPLVPDDDVFTVLERILVMNGVAVNLTRISSLRSCPEYTDWLVTFNRVPTL